jgi:HSP20 family protein
MLTQWHKFDRNLGELSRNFHGLFGGAGLECGVVGPANTEVNEEEEHYTVTVDMPGVDPEKLSVRIENQVLTIEGKRGDRDAVYRRRYRVPATVDAEKLEASLNLGVLTVTLPKAESSKSRDVPITFN